MTRDDEPLLRTLISHPFLALAREWKWDDAQLAAARKLIDITVIRLLECFSTDAARVGKWCWICRGEAGGSSYEREACPVHHSPVPAPAVERWRNYFVRRAAANYFNEGRCSGHEQFNGRYCRDAAGSDHWCIHCAGFVLLQAFDAAMGERTRQPLHVSPEQQALKLLLSSIPKGTDWQANRYDTDDEMVLTMWRTTGPEPRSLDYRTSKRIEAL